MTSFHWALIIVSAIAIIAIWWTSRSNSKSQLKGWNPDESDTIKIAPPDVQLDLFAKNGGMDEFGVSRPRSVKPKAAEMVLTFYVAERSGTPIMGPHLHNSLREQGLVYGDQMVYHRMFGRDSVYSICGLLKPGTLNPMEASRYSSPGLAIHLPLPLPNGMDGQDALEDLINTAYSIAAQINADVYDSSKRLLTKEVVSELHESVAQWQSNQEAE